MKLLTILAILALTLAGGVAKADEFYKYGLQMGSAGCPGVQFNCGSLSSSRSQIVDAANQCIAQRFQISDAIMTDYQNSGQFENCVTPSRMFKEGDQPGSWAVCCVKKVSDSCELACTRYIDQKGGAAPPQ